MTVGCADAGSGSPATAPAGPVAAIPLAPGQGPDAAAVEVAVPASAAQARLDVAGVSQPADELTAELEARASGEVRRWPVDAAAGGVSVTVPIYAVPAGEHVLTLWQGDATVVGRYRFRVIVR